MRRLAFLALLALLAATPSAHGVSRVVGGSAVDVRDAPWSVLIVYQLDAGATLCTGAILDPTRVLTAAHCLVDKNTPYTAANLAVLAGVTNAASPSPTDRRQVRPVASFRLHPGYTDEDVTGADDVAVITLASPLDLSGPTARAIALPGGTVKWTVGESVAFAGYGAKSSNTQVDGTLNGMTSTLVDQTECMRRTQNSSNGVLLCAFAASSSPCGGDSGGALVRNDAVIGIARAVTQSCSNNTRTSYTDVTAPEILQFVNGSDNPPSAPRPTGETTLERPTAVMQVGQTVTCKPGGWNGNPTRFAYEFREATNDTVIRSGPSPAYKLGVGDVGRTLFCRVLAGNEGGTTFDESPLAPSEVQPEPQLVVEPTTARRGGAAVVRVKLADWARPLGKVSVCVKFSPRIGGKACRVAAPAGSTPTVVMQLRVKPTAPFVRARATVTAKAADGRSAIGPAFVVVAR